MTPKRARRTQDLPPYLHEQDGVYIYRNRGHNLYARLGSDRKRAIAAARKVNERLLAKQAAQDLEDKIEGTEFSFATALDHYLAKRKARGLAQGTLDNDGWKAKRYRKLWGSRDIRDIQTLEITQQLEELTASAYPKHRDFLVGVWSIAVARGVVTSNVAEGTLREAPPARARERLDYDLFIAVRDHDSAPAWLRNAMDLSLLTLQARQELVNMQYSDVKDGRLHIIRQKTEKKTDKAFMALEVTPELRQLIGRTHDGLLSPFVLHNRPRRRKPNKRFPRKHWTQLTPDQLTREFARIKKLVAPEVNTAFHEIRSLGAFLLRKQGVDEAQVQALLGHSSVKMSRYYMSGHEIEWSVCTPALDVEKIAGSEA